MKLLLVILPALLVSYLSLSYAQYTCLSSGQVVTSDLPSCDYLNNTYTQCNDLTGNALNSCVCTQKLLSSIFDCESEYRQCLDSYEEDGEIQQVLANWHSECDTFVTFAPTTPVLSTPTFTIGNPICTNIESICTFGGSITRACKESFPSDSQTASLYSCLCQSSLLSAASVCEYDGNITCLGTPATLTSIDLWVLCPAQASAFLTHTATMLSTSLLSSNIIHPAASSSPFQASLSTVPSTSFTAASFSSPLTSSPTATISQAVTIASSASKTNDARVLTPPMACVLASLVGSTLIAAQSAFI